VWFIFRPDAVNVWKNSRVRERYQRYRAILDGKKKARYLVVKKIPIEEELNAPLEKLWKEHEKKAKEFTQVLKDLDQEKISLKEMPEPENSFLDLKEAIARRILQRCHFCERRCKVDRTKGEVGVCRVGEETMVSSAFLHTGEESILVPSGTIFFTGCTFKCAFCQNYDISQEWCDDSARKRITSGVVTDAKQLSLLAERLWKEGAKNINFVGGDPTPNLHTIITSLKHLQANITLLWNSNNYQSIEATKLLLELMDFWLPDFKFWDDEFAKQMSGVKNYREVITRNLKMAYDFGSGEILVRHLIMPGRVEDDTVPILEWCSKEIPRAMVNLMDQYHPDYLVARHPRDYETLNRRILPSEWKRATQKADELGVFWRPVS